jgi:uncharacterized membrane protein YraQ (UPF0718 family)
MMNIIIWTLAIILLLVSFFLDRHKTIKALITAWKSFSKIAPIFFLVLVCYALLVSYISPETIQQAIGNDSGLAGVALSLGLGSISVMPGFAAFPLCAALYTQGIPYYILAAFSLTLMNVGIVTFPIEQKYLGTKVALIRNLLGLSVSIIAMLIVKLVFGE